MHYLEISYKDLTSETLEKFNKTIPKQFLTDGVVIKPNDVGFEDKETPEL